VTKVFLDDERDPRVWLPHMRWFRGRDLAELEDWTWATTAPEAIAILETRAVDEVSLDHDLGDEAVVGTGYDVLLWIEERVATDPGYEPPMIHIHTSNIGSRGRMESAVQGIQRLVR
jgi:Cyclic-phosphate processing Receiver domain